MDNKRYLETLEACGVLRDIDKEVYKTLCKSEYDISKIVKILGTSIIESVGLFLSMIADNEHEKVMVELERTCRFIVKYIKDDKIKNIFSFLYMLHSGDSKKEDRKLTYVDLEKSIKELKVNDLSDKVNTIILYDKKTKLYLEGTKIWKYFRIEGMESAGKIRAIVYIGDKIRLVKEADDYKAIIQEYKKNDNFDLMIVPYIYEEKFGKG